MENSTSLHEETAKKVIRQVPTLIHYFLSLKSLFIKKKNVIFMCFCFCVIYCCDMNFRLSSISVIVIFQGILF